MSPSHDTPDTPDAASWARSSPLLDEALDLPAPGWRGNVERADAGLATPGPWPVTVIESRRRARPPLA